MTDDTPLWKPSPASAAAAPMTAFMAAASGRSGRRFADFGELHRWSVDDRESFWSLVWDFCGVVGEKGDTVLVETGDMPAASFFPEVRLNFAENLLKKRGAGEAIVFRGEDRLEARLSFDDLAGQVSRLQQFLLAEGVGPGDRVAAMMPNMPQAVVAMLAAASIGAVWSSCSPDFGEQGVLDRFGQIEPVILIVPDGYYYAGKVIDVAAKVGAIAGRLPSLRRILVADYLGRAADLVSGLAGDDFRCCHGRSPVRPIEFRVSRSPIRWPSSTRPERPRPKCIVHSAGGTLLQHVKNTGCTPASAKATASSSSRPAAGCGTGWSPAWPHGATLLLYDGSPFWPTGNVLVRFRRGREDEPISGPPPSSSTDAAEIGTEARRDA